MTILDTFYLLFKTDIPTGAKKDIIDLDKQIDILAAKGKKRSEEENKEYKELQKRRKEATQDLKDQQKEVDKIGDSFKDLATNALEALTAFATFNGIKSGILGSAKFNADIATQSEVTHQSAEELRAYGAAFATFGGDADAFIKKQFAVRQAVIANGVEYKNVAAFYNSIHDLLMKYPDSRTQALNLQRAGITDVNEQAFLLDKNYYENIRIHKELAAATREDYEEAIKFRKASEDAGTAFTTAFTRLGTDILPFVSTAFKELNTHLKDLEKEQGGIESFFLKVGAAAALLVTPFKALIGVVAVADEVGKSVTDVASGSRNSFLGRKIDQYILGATDEPQSPPSVPTPKPQAQNSDTDYLTQLTSGGDKTDPNFWIARGYDEDEAKYMANLNSVRDLTKEIRNTGGQIGQQYGNIPALPGAAGSGTTASGGKALNVKIDEVNINTQATDADGISAALSQKLEQNLGELYYDWNDGVDY